MCICLCVKGERGLQGPPGPPGQVGEVSGLPDTVIQQGEKVPFIYLFTPILSYQYKLYILILYSTMFLSYIA